MLKHPETESQSELRVPDRPLPVYRRPMSELPAADPSRATVRAIALRHLRAGQPARVVQLSGRPEYIHRLLEFGFRPGCCFELLRSGNPCIVRMEGTPFCLRTDRRLDVLVEPLEAPAAPPDAQRPGHCRTRATDRAVPAEAAGQ